MASNAKTALVFILLLATVMAAYACTNCPTPVIPIDTPISVQQPVKYVACKNEYCEPITVNGIVIEANLTVNVLVNVTGTIILEVKNLLGEVITGTYTCPSDVTALVFVQVPLGLVVKVLAAVTASLVDSVLAILDVSLAICIIVAIGL